MITTAGFAFSRHLNLCSARNICYRLYNLLILACLLLSVTTVASARTFTLDKLRFGGQEFSGFVSYEVEKAYAGNSNLEVMVSFNTRGTTGLQLLKFEASDPSKITFKRIREDVSFDPATGLLTTEFRYLADISAATEPRIYLITLSLGYPGEKNTDSIFWFYAGVRNKGKLNVVTNSVSTTELFTGISNKYSLELENNFPNYPVNVRSITIKSDPAGLIENTTIPVGDFSIDSLQRRSLDLDLNAASMSFTNLLSGFSDSTQLILNVTYDDGYGRVITDLSYPLKVKLRARDRILVIAMLIGVLIGALLKLHLQLRQQQGINGRDKLIAVGTTILIGSIVSIVAVVGRIKIMAFDLRGSYDNPAVIFLIGIAGAVGGAKLLSMIFRQESSGPTPPAATPAGPVS